MNNVIRKLVRTRETPDSSGLSGVGGSLSLTSGIVDNRNPIHAHLTGRGVVDGITYPKETDTFSCFTRVSGMSGVFLYLRVSAYMCMRVCAHMQDVGIPLTPLTCQGSPPLLPEPRGVLYA